MIRVEVEHQGIVPLECEVLEIGAETQDVPWVTVNQLRGWLGRIAGDDRNSDWALYGFSILVEEEGCIVRIGDGSDHEDILVPLIGETVQGEPLYVLTGWGHFVLSDEEVV